MAAKSFIKPGKVGRRSFKDGFGENICRIIDQKTSILK